MTTLTRVICWDGIRVETNSKLFRTVMWKQYTSFYSVRVKQCPVTGWKTVSHSTGIHNSIMRDELLNIHAVHFCLFYSSVTEPWRTGLYPSSPPLPLFNGSCVGMLPEMPLVAPQCMFIWNIHLPHLHVTFLSVRLMWDLSVDISSVTSPLPKRSCICTLDILMLWLSIDTG